MNPKDARRDKARVNKKDPPDAPLEDQPKEWSDEDLLIEDRKPDLGESEDDTSEL